MKFWQRSLQARLTLYFVLFLLISGVVIGVLAYWQTRSALQEDVLQRLDTAATLKENEINRWLTEKKQEARLLSRTPIVATSVETLLSLDLSNPAAQQAYERLGGYFTDVLAESPSVLEIWLLDAEGRIIYATDEAKEGDFHVTDTFFVEGLKDTFAQNVYFLPAVNRTTVTIANPMSDETGETAGVLVVHLNLDRLDKIILERAGLGETGQTYLVDGLNVFISQTEVDPADFPRGIHTEGIDRAVAGENGSGFYPNYYEVPVIGVYRWLPDHEMALLAEMAQSEALAPANRLGLIIGFITLLVVGLGSLAGYLSARQISRPVVAIAQSASQVALGDLSQQVPVTSQDELGQLGNAFNSMTTQLRDLVNTLEDRIKGRTQALETSAEISRQVAAILNLDELLQYVVNRIQTEFGFYHTHIYLVEAESGDLVMAEGSGEVGQQLKAKGHRLPGGQGIVGTAASTNESFFSSNVDDLLNFSPNPLLPDTKSELAVPLRKGTQVLGVLDIQSDQVGRFTTEDVGLMQALANQIAIAIDNARLVAETQTAMQEVERLNRRLTRESWEEFGKDIQTTGYHYQNGVTSALPAASNVWLSPMKQAVQRGQLVKQSHPGNGEPAHSELAVPLILRNQVIGVVGVKRAERPIWSEEEVSAVESLAGQIARALENARLATEQEKTIVQLQEIDRLKSEFLTSMSHELRTPLNSIIGFADVIIQGIDGELSDLAMNDVKLIHNSGQHLLALINDILDINKIEAGMMELVREPLNLNESVGDVLAASSSLVKNKPVKIVADISEELPEIFADKLRLNQILLNLISNAVKFTHDGSITIKAVVDEQDTDRARISIIDTGIGIPTDKLGTIFDRFRQADSSTTREYGGTGLGLAICRQLVELHEGKLDVRSKVGIGSEFYFTIPLAGVEELEA